MTRYFLMHVHLSCQRGESIKLLDSLKRALYDAVYETIPESRVAVAFSGGIDSALLAKICGDLGKNILLITVGFSDSHDVNFSRRIAAQLGMEHKVVEIGEDNFQKTLNRVRQISRCTNTSHIENCLAYAYVSRGASQAGLSVVLSANGCDELFCGYTDYRLAYDQGKDALMALMDSKIASEMELVQEIANVAMQFGVAVRQPFLSNKFVALARSIPLDSKITGSDDMLRKHILRSVALDIGVPAESATKQKKALQYGSSIHKHFKNVAKKDRFRG